MAADVGVAGREDGGPILATGAVECGGGGGEEGAGEGGVGRVLQEGGGVHGEDSLDVATLNGIEGDNLGGASLIKHNS